MSYQNERNPLPENWLQSSDIADNLFEGKFLIFKAPLDAKFDSKVPRDRRFYPEAPFLACEKLNVKMGLWIDLTNTKRYYRENEVEIHNCEYVKHMCSAKMHYPTEESIQAFINIIQKFILVHPTKVIGVHCNQGFNLTGFMLVSYCVKHLNYTLERALDAFTAARPPGIYSKGYMNELYSRYDDIENVRPIYSGVVRGSMGNDVIGTLSSAMNDMNVIEGHKISFMEGVPQVTEFTTEPKRTELRHKVHKWCNWKKPGLPGTMVVNLNSKNLTMLSKEPYKVTWKPVGNRYFLMILKKDDVYFFDVNFNVFKTEGMHFPKKQNINQHITDTLLDGIMVMDTIQNKKRPRFYVFDIIYLEGEKVGVKPLADRIDIINDNIILPRSALGRYEPFKVEGKPYFEVSQTEFLISDGFISSLSHASEGVAFYPMNAPYKSGTCEEIFKWRPVNQIQIKFKLKIVEEFILGSKQKVGQLFVGRLHTPFARMKYSDRIQKYDGKIISCYLENNEWKFDKERNDRAYPNSIRTASAVCETIRDNITKQKLLDYIKNYVK